MTRLDAALAARGLARSRTHAATLIADGMVRVAGHPVVKASTSVSDEVEITVDGGDQYVSRGAHKLIAALDSFTIPVADRVGLDLGASTGGFTQVLRERGARPVLAVDVGHGQLAPSIAADPDVISVEGYNVRHMSVDNLAEATGISERPDIVVGDLSFISLTLVLPAIAGVAAPTADVVLLVKPQFEVGRTAVRGGLVTNPTLRMDAVERTLWAAHDVGFGVRGLIASPILGTHGNAEYLLHLAIGGEGDPSQWTEQIAHLAGGR